MYEEDACGSGTGYPSSLRPSTWNSMASRMFRSASSRVFPVETQPEGRVNSWSNRLRLVRR